MTDEHAGYNCPQCKRGLWCADGKRGQFVRGDNTCKLCGRESVWHSTKEPKVTR